MKILGLVFLFASPALAQPLDSMIDRELPSLVATYKALHAAPELSMREEKTSALLAARLRELGYTVADHIGNFGEPGTTCYGVGRGDEERRRTDRPGAQ
jgi:metal-dependent amidase/aminoacylase/carboxypeptidase family protein